MQPKTHSWPVWILSYAAIFRSFITLQSWILIFAKDELLQKLRTHGMASWENSKNALPRYYFCFGSWRPKIILTRKTGWWYLGVSIKNTIEVMIHVQERSTHLKLKRCNLFVKAAFFKLSSYYKIRWNVWYVEYFQPSSFIFTIFLLGKIRKPFSAKVNDSAS